jgi:hypothetical protein
VLAVIIFVLPVIAEAEVLFVTLRVVRAEVVVEPDIMTLLAVKLVAPVPPLPTATVPVTLPAVVAVAALPVQLDAVVAVAALPVQLAELPVIEIPQVPEAPEPVLVTVYEV